MPWISEKRVLKTFSNECWNESWNSSDEFGNKYYKSKNNERWVVYSSNIEATKITSDWYLWIHHTIDKIPDIKELKYSWQKKHLENQTGSKNSYKPIKISKNYLPQFTACWIGHNKWIGWKMWQRKLNCVNSNIGVKIRLLR